MKYGNWFGLDAPTGIIGHFTQIVWHSTFNIGCGFIQMQDPEEDYVDEHDKERITSVSVRIFILEVNISNYNHVSKRASQDE